MGAERFAAIDVGSNGIRLLVVEANGPDKYTIVHQERAAVRLGHNTFREGRLDPEQASAAIAALRAFQGTMHHLGVRKSRAVATSAVREASDGKVFRRRIKDELGIKLHVIDGAEEARLVHRAVRRVLDVGEDRWLIMDLGGGSLELSLADKHHIHWAESRPLGTVRLLEAYESDDHDDFVENLHEALDRFQILRVPHRISVHHLVAAGGNIGALAQMAGLLPAWDEMPPHDQPPAELPLKTLRNLAKRLETMTVDERIDQYGFRPDRADVILPAALVYERVATLFGADTILVPDVGVKEGLVLDLMDRHYHPARYKKRLRRDVEDSAYGLGRTFRFEEGHHVHVARLAADMFDQLEDLHGLGEKDRRILKAAALLHDVGKVISDAKHHKHSAYIIGNAELPGLNLKATQMAAAVARYHRKAMPKAKHPIYKDLEPKDRARVDRLAAILRVSDALDKRHAQTITRLECEVTDDELILRVEGEGSFQLQRWALAKKSDLFQKVFGRNVRLVAPDDPLPSRSPLEARH